jgi:type I restriction enzyme R subunit
MPSRMSAGAEFVRTFNENTRVKIPALVHFTRLGYTYLSLNHATRDETTNIFTGVFRDSLARINPEVENLILADNNLTAIRHSPEYQTNKDPNSPTNRLSTALFSRDRLAFLLRFAFAYVRGEKSLEKHVMRYPQVFATKAIIRMLEAGIRKGIIWHTQGSGKTALAYYNVHHLTAWFQKQGIVPKFYFIVDRIQVLKGENHRTQLYAHERFVEPMLDYIVEDFGRARLTHNDGSIGAMVICDSADQARMMAEIFSKKYAAPEVAVAEPLTSYPLAAEQPAAFKFTPRLELSVRKHALILHDEGTKEQRKQWVDDFKDGKIDILFVFNMLLTGFDAKRLKKLYLGRVIKAHNLLQALTRVNRPFKSFRYGYVVDFADIQAEFEKTNKAYFDELQSELGDETEHYSDLFKTEEEITAEIEAIKDALFHFDTANAEIFSRQVSEIRDREQMRAILKALENAKSLYNLIRFSGRYQLLDQLDFRKLNLLAIEANNHMALLNQRDALENDQEATNLLNIALEEVLFTFRKVSEAELRIADELRDTLRRTREGLATNFDPRDPVFISLREELERLFRKKKLSEITQEEMKSNITALNGIHARARELERKNQLLRAKYANDAKYARIHKRLMEKGEPTANERKLCEALGSLKAELDARIAENAELLTNQPYAEKMITRMIIEQLMNQHSLPLTPNGCRFINQLVLREYLDEFNEQQPA